jgi:FixJ family two-component response regulator
MTQDHVVFVVDDDASMRMAIKRLVEAVGMNVETFASGKEFLDSQLPDVPACVVLDVRLPGMSGLDIQRELAQRDRPLPVVFVTGHGDIPMSVRAMKDGAVEFLTKPFREQDLLDAVAQAIEADREELTRRAELALLHGRFASLTPREHEVLSLVVAGLLNKQIAAELGISEKTVKIHRGQVMQKMDADSLPELTRMAERLGVDGSTGSIG